MSQTVVNNYITITDSVITRSQIGEVTDKNLPPPEKAGYVDASKSNKMKIQGKMAVSELARLELETKPPARSFEISPSNWNNYCQNSDAVIKALDAIVVENRELQSYTAALSDNVRDLTFGQKVPKAKSVKLHKRIKKADKSLAQLEKEGRKPQEKIDKTPISFGTIVWLFPFYIGFFFSTVAACWEYKTMSFFWR